MPHRFVSLLCCVLVMFPMIEVSAAAQRNSAPAAPDQAPLAVCKQPCLEDGTPIKLRIAQTVSSADAHVDDRVEFEVLEEIRIQGVLIVSKGGIALGTVTEAQPKRRMARGGKLEIVMDSVRLVDGEKAALRATKGGHGGGHTGAMTAGIVATALIFWPAAPFFLFIHGKDITIPKGAEVPTFVNGNMPLDLAKFQQSGSASQQAQSNSVNQVQPSIDASIDITSTPTGADVVLDGSFVGSTPSVIGVSTGDHTISVKKIGYKFWERKIKVSSGKVNISADLEVETNQTSASVPATATLPSHPVKVPTAAHETASAGTSENLGAVSFTSDQAGAEIYVDNSSVGKTPITLRLKIGPHYIRMFMNGYKNWSQQIMVVGGSELKVAAKLEKSE